MTPEIFNVTETLTNSEEETPAVLADEKFSEELMKDALKSKKYNALSLIRIFIFFVAFLLFSPLTARADPDIYENDDTFEQAGVIVLNDETVQHHNFHDAGDEDWVKFYGLAQESYRIDAKNPGTNFDVVIRLYDTDGMTFLTKGDHGFDGENEYLDWTCPQDGVYYIKVENFTSDIYGENATYDLMAFRPHSCVSGLVTGSITDAVSGKAVSGVLMKTGINDSAISEPDGTYRLFAVCGCESPFAITADADGYDTYTETITAVCGGSTSKNISMTSKAMFSGPGAIIVAGGPDSGNRLWDATQMTANLAYRTLLYQGFTKESIFYLNPDTDIDMDGNGMSDDVDGTPTKTRLQDAVISWASGADSLTVFLTGIGGSGVFRISGTEILSATELDSWLDTLQQSFPGKVTVICDASESGSFLSALTPPAGKSRMVLTSTSSGENACFLTQGFISFSTCFWNSIFTGDNVSDAFNLAKEAMTNAAEPSLTKWQTPLLDDNGNGVNDDGDGTLANATFIGNGTPFPGAPPVIGNISPGQGISGSDTAMIYAEDVTDPDGIVRVWAIVIPPGYTQEKKALVGLPSFDLTRTEGNRYEGISDGFDMAGRWQVAVYAMDRFGNISSPKPTTVTVENPSGPKAIIVAGGSPSDILWPATEKNAGLAYEALRFQGYSDDDIYLMSGVAFSAQVDASATLDNLSDAVSAWADTQPRDGVLYLVGNGDTGIFEINDTERLSAAELDRWLDSLQNEMSGRITVIYDACRSGSFLPLLTPVSGKERVLISGAGVEQPACFLSEGDISFSGFFWRGVSDGATVREAFSDAGNALSASCKGQVPLLDDNGNGVGNEVSDGQVVGKYTFGVGIVLAGDVPAVGSVSPEQVLQEDTSADIWAADVTTTGGINKVWAVITPPGTGRDSCDAFQPEKELVYHPGSGRYEGTYDGYSGSGAYAVAVYAMDMDGNLSRAVTTSVRREAEPITGDMNADGNVDLSDAIIALKAAAGADVSGVIRSDYAGSGVDADGDNRAGVGEAVYILKNGE